MLITLYCHDFSLPLDFFVIAYIFSEFFVLTTLILWLRSKRKTPRGTCKGIIYTLTLIFFLYHFLLLIISGHLKKKSSECAAGIPSSFN